VRTALIESEAPTRRAVAVVDGVGQATVFNEPGTPQRDAVWARVSATIARLAPSASVLTISGSLPPGADPDLVLRWTLEAQGRGLRVVLDVGGEPLVRALAARPAIAKPNLTEARQALDGAGKGTISAGDAAFMLADAGARAAIVSDGAHGVTLLCDEVELHAWLPTSLHGNATGAGDALTASLAADLDVVADLPAGRDDWAEVLRRGVAWSAAAVLQPVAGAVDPDDVERILPSVEIEEIRV
jgi:tagatose 6-phosphate kinase